MSLVNISSLSAWPGIIGSLGGAPAIATDATLDASGEYVSYVFQAREAMTLSHVGWRTGAVAGSPTADTRIETVGTDGIPSGNLWATNTNIVSGTLSATTWTLHALTASASIAKGDFFAVKVVYASGTSLIVQRITNANNALTNVPYRVTNTSGSAVKSAMAGNGVNFAFGSSTTAFYNLENAYAATTFTASSFSNSAAGAKRGLRFQVPHPCRCAGIRWHNSTQAGDFNAILFNDAGTELSSSSTAFEGDRSALGNAPMIAIFDSPVELTPGNWYRIAIEPSSATNVNVSFFTMPGADYNEAYGLLAGLGHYTTFTTAGGWVDSATDQIPLVEPLLDRAGGMPMLVNSMDQIR